MIPMRATFTTLMTAIAAVVIAASSSELLVRTSPEPGGRVLKRECRRQVCEL